MKITVYIAPPQGIRNMRQISKGYNFEIKEMLSVNRLSQISDRHQRYDSCGC